MEHILTILIYIISFCLFILLQSLVINGIYYCFGGSCTDDLKKGRICNGNIFFLINPEFFERNKSKIWSRNLYSCPRCMASTYSLITFFPLVIYLFGFHYIELFAWVIDAFSLTTLNYIIFKKL